MGFHAYFATVQGIFLAMGTWASWHYYWMVVLTGRPFLLFRGAAVCIILLANNLSQIMVQWQSSPPQRRMGEAGPFLPLVAYSGRTSPPQRRMGEAGPFTVKLGLAIYLLFVA